MHGKVLRSYDATPYFSSVPPPAPFSCNDTNMHLEGKEAEERACRRKTVGMLDL